MVARKMGESIAFTPERFLIYVQGALKWIGIFWKYLQYEANICVILAFHCKFFQCKASAFQIR